MELIVRHRDREESLQLERTESGYRISVGDNDYEVDVARAGEVTRSLVIQGRQHEVAVRRQKEGVYAVNSELGVDEVELMDPLTHLARLAHEASGGGAQQVTAYMPGRVVEVLVAEGDEVAAGQGILVLEAMKMKNEIQAEASGVVSKLHVAQDQTVEGGDPLFEIA
ncbi:MAG: biotin/lipoyl-containing protein [Acidobacteriota bacterium]